MKLEAVKAPASQLYHGDVDGENHEPLLPLLQLGRAGWKRRELGAEGRPQADRDAVWVGEREPELVLLADLALFNVEPHERADLRNDKGKDGDRQPRQASAVNVELAVRRGANGVGNQERVKSQLRHHLQRVPWRGRPSAFLARARRELRGWSVLNEQRQHRVAPNDRRNHRRHHRIRLWALALSAGPSHSSASSRDRTPSGARSWTGV